MQKYINSLLNKKLGAYLDGLENTQMSWGSVANIILSNVKIRGDALDKFMLPVDIKFGTIKELHITVPVFNIYSSNVEVKLTGMDLILAPKVQKDWKFNDIFSEQYMKEKLIKVAESIISDIAAEQEQGWRDKLKIRVLDNMTMNIKDVHIRFEDIQEYGDQRRNQVGQTTFGILLSELDLKTVDAEGNAIFHDRAKIGGKITKILKMEGLAIYLNPQDTLIIHQIAAENPDLDVQISSMQALMDRVVTPYRRHVEINRENQDVPIHNQQMIETTEEEEFLTYILRPMNLNLMYEHESTSNNKYMNISIKLDQLQLSLQHQQLKAILKIVKSVQNYKKMAYMQEKLRKFRQFRPLEIIESLDPEQEAMSMEFGSGGLRPGFNPKAWWKFAITSIIKSFQFKRGAIKAFKMQSDLEQQSMGIFKEQMVLLFQPKMDGKKRIVFFREMDPVVAKTFWHVVSIISPDQLLVWSKDVIRPIEEAKYRKNVTDPDEQKVSKFSSLKTWIFGKKEEPEPAAAQQVQEGGAQEEQKIDEAEDSFDEEFFDCVETQESELLEEEKKQENGELKDNHTAKNNTYRDRTSFTLNFNIKELSLTLGKLNASNKIDGIQLYNRSVSICTKSPTLNIDKQFVTQAKIAEWGVSLITLNRHTNQVEESVDVIQTNKNQRNEDNSQVYQWDMTLIKNNTAESQNDIELDLVLQIGQVVFKYDEDLIIRGKAISRLKVDSSIQSEALDQLEELRDNTQSAINTLIYKRRNRYNISIGSPIVLLPINGSFEGKFAPIWAIRTGTINFATVDPQDTDDNSSEQSQNSGIYEDLSPDNINNSKSNRFSFAEAVRRLMRGSKMPKSRGNETDQYTDHFRVSISQMGMTYYQSYKIYTQHEKGQIGVMPNSRRNTTASNVLNMPQIKLDKQTSLQQNMIDQDNPDLNVLQSLQKFDILDEFEINILLKIKKKIEKVVIESEREKEKFLKLPKILMKIDTSSINIRLSHTIYNNLYNLKHIFTISKEKAKEYNKELTQFNVQIKQQLVQEAKMQGFVHRKIFIDEQKSQYERNYCILSGNHLYFYKDQDQLLYIDHYYLKQTDIQIEPSQNQAGPKFFELVLTRSTQQAAEPKENLKKSMFKSRRPSLFNFDSFEAGTVRKIRFDSNQDMQAWIDQIKEVTIGMDLEWGDPKGNFAVNLHEHIAEQPKPNSADQKESIYMRRRGIGYGGISDQKRMMALKSFQQNQMHGNFNDLVTTVMTSHGDEESAGSNSRIVEDEDDIIQFELDVSIPQFEVELMKLKLDPSLKKVASPAIFEKWVTYSMIGMSMWIEQRKFDQYIKAQINKISLKDESMIINERLMTQINNSSRKTTHNKDQSKLLKLIKQKLGSNQDFEEPSMLVEKKTLKRPSPRFAGIYSHTNVQMANIQINFMPGTYNNIVKLLRATKKQTKPVDDEFQAGQEYDSNAESAKDDDDQILVQDMDGSRLSKSDDNSSDNSTDIDKNPILEGPLTQAKNQSLKSSMVSHLHQNRRYSIDAEQEMVAKATDTNENRNYDLDCNEETARPMLVEASFKRISIGMLHPKYQMELFRLQTNSMEVRYEIFYDHAELSVKFSRTTLNDLTGHPYSISPKNFFKFIRKKPNLMLSPQAKVLKNPREMIYFNELKMKVYMIQSNNCPHKVKGFSSNLEMRIDTMRINHIQEINLRFNDYFMEQFMDCFFMSDPYKDPKKIFDEIRERQTVYVRDITQDTDFQFPEEISRMDVQISNFEMKVKDRPASKDYLLFEIPLISCHKTKGTIDGLIARKPHILFQSESIWTDVKDINFWFGRESGVRDLTVKDARLSLLKKPFQISVEYKKMSGSEVIAKIDPREIDKAARVNLIFTPIELIWPQSIYTYMLRCADLNFSYTDGLTEEYFFIKWLDMSEHYMSQQKIISKKFDIQIPALSMQLQNSDGSYIAEMIFKQFRQLQTNYTDTDKEINVSCQQFFILGKIIGEKDSDSQKQQQSLSRDASPSKVNTQRNKSQKRKNPIKKEKDKKLRQAVFCPMSSPMYVSSDEIIHSGNEEQKEEGEKSPNNMTIFTRMAPGGDKTNTIDINGLKIFVKFQTFILLQSFFMNAFPSYQMDSIDKPNGFNEDPERENTMVVQFNIFNSLICFINKPGQDSICCQGDITIDMIQESISRSKEKYKREIENLIYRPRRNTEEGIFPEFAADFEPDLEEGKSRDGNSTTGSSEKQEQEEEAVAQISRIYFQKITVKNFTPFICKLEQLDSLQSFQNVKKRQMMNPVDINFESKYNLKHEQQRIGEQSNISQDQANSHQDFQNRRQRGISVDDICNDDEDDTQQQNSRLLGNLPNSAPMHQSLLEQSRQVKEFILPHGESNHSSNELRRELKWVWGVTCEQNAHIGVTKLRISIQDVHLLFQIIAFSSDQMTSESVNKLKEIHDDIEERENFNQNLRRKTEVQNQLMPKQLTMLERPESLQINTCRSQSEMRKNTQNDNDTKASMGFDNDQQFNKIPEVTQLEEEQSELGTNNARLDVNETSQEMFEGLIEKLENKFEPTMSSQVERLRASTQAFRKIANGYTQKKYLERSSFLEFLNKDILTSEDERDGGQSDYESVRDHEIEDQDQTGEESRRRTILRIHQRNMNSGITSTGVITSNVNSQLLVEQSPKSQLSHQKIKFQIDQDSRRVSESGFQSDIKDEQSIEQLNHGIIEERQNGLKSRKKSSLATGSGSEYVSRPGLNANNSLDYKQSRMKSQYSRDRRDTIADRITPSHNKESMQDALSEFFYSCAGKSAIGKDRSSQHSNRSSNRGTPVKLAMGQETISSHQPSDYGSDSEADDHIIQGEIEEEQYSYKPAEHRSQTQTHQNYVFGANKANQSKSFGMIVKSNFIENEQVQSSINGSIIDKDAKAFLQENETVMARSTRQDLRDVYKHCMDNIIKTESEMYCSRFSFLFINDFNQAFTPVIEVQMTGLDLKQRHNKEDDHTEQNMSIIQMTGSYFNLELGEWEPLIEHLAFKVFVNNTLTQNTMIVNFDETVRFNFTQACMRNISYTMEAWYQMPDFIQPKKKTEPKKEHQSDQKDDSQIPSKKTSKMQMVSDSDDNATFSINSSNEDDNLMQSTSQKLISVQENLRRENISSNYIIEEELSSQESQVKLTEVTGPDSRQANQEEENLLEDNSQLEQITPFQIKNQTSNVIQVVQGGINEETRYYMMDSETNPHVNHEGGVMRLSQATSGMKTTNYHFGSKKAFSIEQGKQCNYSVTYAQLVDEQQKNQKRLQLERKAQMNQRLKSQQLKDLEVIDSNNENDNDGGFLLLPDSQDLEDMGSPADQENITTFKNAILVGVKVNVFDFINSIDLNEISRQDPYVFNISSSYSWLNQDQEFDHIQLHNRFTAFDKLTQRDAATEAEARQQQSQDKMHKMKASQLIMKHKENKDDRLGLYYNYIFYGVVLDKMQKQLIIRTPYVFYNKTLLTIEVIIKRSASKNETAESLFTQNDVGVSTSQSPKTLKETMKSQRARFILKPEEKFPLDQNYYQETSIIIRIVDQNSILAFDTQNSETQGLGEGGSNQSHKDQSKQQVSKKSIQSGSKAQKSANSEDGQNRGRFLGRKFSKEVPIEKLVNLELNQGAGQFIAGPEADSLCVTVKRQSGELYGTTDLVFLPVLSVKNALPCSMKIKRKKRLGEADELVLRQSSMEEKTYYSIMKSEQKDFYTFDGCGDNGNEISLHIHVDGFLLSNEIRLNQRNSTNQDVEIQDRFDNRLTIAMRVSPTQAGYQVTFSAYVVIQLETLRLLNSDCIRVSYEAETIKQQVKAIAKGSKRQMLAGQEGIYKNRFVMANKDQNICVSVKERNGIQKITRNNTQEVIRQDSIPHLQNDYFGARNQSAHHSQVSSNVHIMANDDEHEISKGKNIFFSQSLDIKQAGKLTDFHVKTDQAEMHKRRRQLLQMRSMKYDFSMSNTLALTDAEDFIFTKMIVISPRYVLVNQMKAPIEVAQVYCESIPNGQRVMEVGDRKEWYWPDHTKDNLICVRKMGHIDSSSALSQSDDESCSDEEDENPDKQPGIECENDESVARKHPYFKPETNTAQSHEFFAQKKSKMKVGDSIESMGLIDESTDMKHQMLVDQNDSADGEEYVFGKQSYINKHRTDPVDNEIMSSSPHKSLDFSPKQKQKRKGQKSNKKDRFGTYGASTSKSPVGGKRFQKYQNSDKLSNVDRVAQWSWSKGFSPVQNEQMTLAIMIREAENYSSQSSTQNKLKEPQLKVIRVTKKLLNNTVFVIFEEESPLFPMYRIINECQNVSIKMMQCDLNEPLAAEVIRHKQNMIFGLYEPEGERKMQLDICIDRNVRGEFYRRGNEEVRIQVVDLNETQNIVKNQIQYQDIKGHDHYLEISLKNDGQTKTIRIATLDQDYQDMDDDHFVGNLRNSNIDNELLKKQEDEADRKKLQKQEQNKAYQVTLNKLLISFVAKVQVQRSEEVLVDENRELALISWKDIKFIYDYKANEKKHKMNFQVGHFQIDNQSEQNPLFQQIFMAKRFRSTNNLDDDGFDEDGRRGDMDERANSTPFVNVEVDYRITHENQVTFVDKFHCSVSDSVVSIDSDYLINFGWAMSNIRPLFENKMARVHPIFMKESIYDHRNSEIEQVNKDDTFSLNNYINSQQTKTGKLDNQTLKKQINKKKKNGQLLLSESDNDLEDPLLTPNAVYRASTAYSEVSDGLDFTALQQARQHELKVRAQEVLKQKELLTNVMGEILIEDKLCQHTVETAPTQLRLWYQQDVAESKDTLYLKEFLIDQINMDLSFVVKTVDKTSSTAQDRKLVGPLAYLKQSGLSLINIDEARFRLARFGVQNLFIGKEDMIKYSQNFYGQRFVSELRKLVGSVGIIASPQSLFYSIGDGFHDLMSMPIDGYTESGVFGFTYGVAAGTISLTKQIGVGSLQSFQQFNRDLSQALLLIAKDKDYVRSREDRMVIEKPTNFVDGFGYGANSFIIGIKGGLLGLVSRPVIEARRRGWRGFGSGIYQSLAGAVMKPLSGTLDMASKSAEGLKNTIRRFDLNTTKERVRIPRPFYGYQQKIKPYNGDDSLLIGEVLTQIGEGRFKDNHYLEMKKIMPTDQNENVHFLILTEEQLFLIEANQKELVWYITTELIHSVKPMNKGIVILLTEEFEGQDSFILQIDQVKSREIAAWLNAIAAEFN